MKTSGKVSIKRLAAVGSIVLVMALVLTFLPAQVSIDTSGLLSIGLNYGQASPSFTARTETYFDALITSSPYDGTVDKPTGTAENNILFALVCFYNLSPKTIDAVPSGWTLAGEYLNNVDRYALYYKVAGDSEPETYTWSFNGACYVRIVCSCYYGDFDTADPIDVISNTGYRTANTIIRAADMSVSAADSPLVFWASVYRTSEATFDKPSVPTEGWVEDDDAGSTTSDFWAEVCSMIWSGSGATGDMDATASVVTTSKHAFCVALNPAQAVEVPTAIKQPATNIGTTVARINGKISDDGGAECEARFRWRKDVTPCEFSLAESLALGYPNDFDVYDSGNRTIIAASNDNKVLLYNTSDKHNAVLLDDLAADYCHDVKMLAGDDDYAYFCRWKGSDEAYGYVGIANLTTETAITQADLESLARAFYLCPVTIGDDKYVLVISHWTGVSGMGGDSTGDGLHIYKVTDHTLTLMDSLTGSGVDYNLREAWRVKYHAGYKYAIVCSNYDGGKVTVLDISDPTDITPLNVYSGAGWAWFNCFIEGNKLYGCEAGTDTIYVCQINADGSLTQLGNYTSSDYLDNCHGIFVENDIIYAAAWFSDGITVLDATDPENITYLGGIYDPALMNDRHAVYYNNGYIWTAGASTYFTIHSIKGEWLYTNWQNSLITDSTFYEDLTSLDPGTEYEFQTQAKNSAGEGDWSDSASFETTVPEITNLPTTNDFGILALGTTGSTAINYFTIENTGGCAVDVTIQGTDATGGDDTWTLSDTATPGENIYGLYAGLDDDDDLFDLIVRKTETYNTLVSGLAEDATQDWGLKIYMPTSVNGYDGQEMTGIITLVASAS